MTVISCCVWFNTGWAGDGQLHSPHVLCTLKVCTMILTIIIIVLCVCIFCYRLGEGLTSIARLCTGVHMCCVH